MDFVKKILHQISRKSEAVSQITFDEDYNVPDARPDVGRMIQKKGEVTIGAVSYTHLDVYKRQVLPDTGRAGNRRSGIRAECQTGQRG